MTTNAANNAADAQATPDHPAAALTFGIEIETIAPIALMDETWPTTARLQIGAYHRGVQVPYLDPGWKAERDASIVEMPGYTACEIVSPVLHGAANLATVARMVETLKAKGHKFNDSCGIHVHVGWPSNAGAQALARLITSVAYAETALYAITGTSRRRDGRFCKPIRSYANATNAKMTLDRDRYHILNLTNLADGGCTVEFRCFPGSLNTTKILGWIQVCLGLVERAIAGTRSPVWMPKPPQGGWKLAGTGTSEAERLLGFLGWGAGYAARHNGHELGWIAPRTVITQSRVIAEFRRLAAKYDQPRQA
jgi:hypothetical protein